mgnify:CR=1 FL=1
MAAAAEPLPEVSPSPPPSWSRIVRLDDVAREFTFQTYIAGDAGPTLLLLHGAGQSALVWSLIAQRMSHMVRVVAFDQRAHGGTGGCEGDLSAVQLVDDVVHVAAAVRASLGVAPDSPLMLVGHSMGGAIAARAGASGRISGLCGVGVVDVVEGTALAALQHMHGVLARRPQSFASCDEAVGWSVHSGSVRSTLSANLSVPSQLVQRPGSPAWRWRTDLAATEKHWRGWFEGLSAVFLSAPVPKVLLLAGTDRLDKALTIAQMQGKFQLVILGDCGHQVHEEKPDDVAQKLLAFLSRQGLVEGTGGGGRGGGGRRRGPSALFPGAGAQRHETFEEKLARAKAMKPGRGGP